MKLCERPGTPKKRPKSSNENHIQEFATKDQKPSVYSVSTDFSAKESLVESDSQEDTSREMSLMEESESTLSDSVPKEPSQQFIVLGVTILKLFLETYLKNLIFRWAFFEVVWPGCGIVF